MTLQSALNPIGIDSQPRSFDAYFRPVTANVLAVVLEGNQPLNQA